MVDIVAILEPTDLTVIDHRVPPAPGGFTPLGIVLHHTASRLSMDPAPSLRTVQHGRADLAGPLCNVLIGRDSIVRAICDGRANDTGGGDPDVLAAVKGGIALPKPDDREGHRVNGNPWFYDIEVENDGVGEPWSPRLVDTTAQVAAVLCAHHQWPASRVICHREWTRRKIDPSELGDWRGRVARILNPPEVARMEADYIRTLHVVYLGLPDSPPSWSREEVASFDYHLWRIQTGTPKEQIRADFKATAHAAGRM